MKDYLLTILRGMAVGIANIIPGVSGGTMALVLGVYERCLAAVSNIKPSAIKNLCFLFSKDSAKKSLAREEFKRLDILFLILLAFGAGIAILALAKVMTILLNFYHDPTYGFFFGLVLASILVPWKLVKKKSAAVFLMVILGAGIGVSCDFLMNSEQKIANAQNKIVVNQLKKEKAEMKAAGDLVALAKIEKQLSDMGTSDSSITYYVKLLAAGALAISAMILPGISGSFLLLALGLYFDILAALASFNIPVIFIFGLGCLVGLMAFSKLLDWLLKNCANGTMGFLTGLMIGSLWTIWPFRASVAITDKLAAGADPVIVYLGNRLPEQFAVNEILTVLTFCAGVAVVALFLVYEKKHQEPQEG